MNREEKRVIIDTLAEKLQQYPHFYLTDISGLDAQQTAALRRQCFDRQISLVVVKNTLFTKALEKVEKADAQLVGVLEGSTSVMFCDNAKAPAALIKEFRKTNPKPILKGAWAQESVFVGEGALEDLINIKSKEELIGQIIGMLQSPAQNVISALQAAGGGKIAGLVKSLEERNN